MFVVVVVVVLVVLALVLVVVVVVVVVVVSKMRRSLWAHFAYRYGVTFVPLPATTASWRPPPAPAAMVHPMSSTKTKPIVLLFRGAPENH